MPKIGKIFILALLVPGIAKAAVATSTDLAIGKTANLTNALVGQTVVFQIGITNLGTNTANIITGSDVVPSGFSVFAWNSSGSPSAPAYNPTNGLWTLASIAGGSNASLTISTLVTNAGRYTNTALISGASIGDPNLNNNTSSVVVVSATQPADLMVTKTAGLFGGGTTSHFLVGDSVTFTITISNLGPGIPFDIAGSDVVPAGFSVTGWSSSGPEAAPNYNPATGVWTLNTLYPDQGAVLSIFATAVGAGSFTNTAAITSASVSDPNPANNSSAVAVTVTQSVVLADLAVTKTASTNSVRVGQQVVFTVALQDLGPNGVLTNIVVTDCLPAGFQYVTDSTVGGGSPGTYSPGTCQWTLPAGIATNATISLHITAQATNTGTFTNTASVAVPSGFTDPNLNNNTSSAVVTVTSPTADLAVTKTASTNSVKFGQQVVFTVALQDLGPNDVLTNIVVTDCLPAGFQYVTDSTVGGGGTGTYSPGTCQWTLPAGIATNATILLHITALATNTGTFTNTASVAVPAGFTDPNLNNNASSAVVTVTPLVADLAVTKTVFTNTMQVFSTFAFYFTLTVTNRGPDTVTNLTLTDLLPAGLPFTGVVTNNGSIYTASNGLWTVTGPLSAGQGATMALTALPANVGTFTNTLKVNVPPYVTDPNTNNNTARTNVYVLPLYRILGYVANCSSNGIPLANVTIRLSGPANLTTTTPVSGNYSFDSVSNGVYTLTPSQPGNIFVPSNAVVTVSNAWVTVPPFVGSIGLIYGQVSYSGSPVTNHPIALTGGGLARPLVVLTDVNGNYIFTNTPVGNYTVTPLQTNGYSFNPTNAAILLNATNCAAITNFSANLRIVQLVALEVTQVIQDWSNSVRLIQNKETYVRAHLQLTNKNAALLQGARLYGTGGGGPLAGSPLPPLNTGGSVLVTTTNASDRAIRGYLTNTFNFRLPPNWPSGNLSLRFECTNNVTIVPTNVVPANSTVSVTFVTSAVPQVKFVGYNWTNAGVVPQMVDLPSFADLPRRFVSLYPVPANTINKLVSMPPAMLAVPTTIPPAIAADNGRGDWALLNANARLKAQKDLDYLISRAFGGGNWLYYGSLAWPSPDTYGWAGAYVTSANTVGTTSFVSSGFVNPAFYPLPDGRARHTSDHEIGHNLGRPHCIYSVTGRGVCNEGGGTVFFPLFQPVASGAIKPTLGPMTNGVNSVVYGLDTLTLRSAPAQNPVVDPNTFFDIMSYCRVAPLDRWISAFTYNAFFAAISNAFTAPPPAAGAPGPPRRWDFLRGFIGGAPELGELLPIVTVSTTNIPPSPPSGDYSLQLYDANSNLVNVVSFDPDSYLKDENSANEDYVALFDVPVLADPTVRRISLWHGTNMLDMKVASSNAPVVSTITLSATNGGPFTGSGPLVVSWAASDADGDPLTYTIQYSADGGVTWETLFVDWPSQSCMLDSQYLQATIHGEIRVVASDGFNTSPDAFSSTFTVPNHAPVVSINTPPDGTLFIADQEIFLDAFANDPQDGALDGSSVQWVSSRDGALGSGAVLNFQADALSVGAHLITVTATDSFGLTNSASVKIYILRLPPPELAIERSGNQLLLSWPSAITNFVLQSSLSLAPANWTPVTNEPVAAYSTQTVTTDLSAQTKFFRLEMLP